MFDSTEFLNNFHFIRPWLLLALPCGLVCLWFFRSTIQNTSGWNKIIDSSLLPFLLETGHEQTRQRLTFPAVLLAWAIASIALAGPTWQQQEQPVIKNQDALVMVLDLTLSMNAEDQKPSRLIAAKRKIEDILNTKKEGENALVVFSGSAHTVSPLTDDSNTLKNMLPALDPRIMPSVGNNVISGIEKALSLLKTSGITKGRILLLTDEVQPRQFKQIKALLPTGIHLSILTFGTEAGAPIPYNGFLKNQKNDEIILAKLDWKAMSSAANQYGFAIHKSTFNDKDLRALGIDKANVQQSNNETSKRQTSLWLDHGYYLLFLLIPFVLMSFRRGWILLALVFVLPDHSYALSWQDVWKTDNQQASELFNNGKAAEAAQTFSDPEWRASSLYKANDFEKAYEAFAATPNKDANTFYNMGNALTQTGKYQDAIDNYDKALAMDPDLEDARFNQTIARKLLEQQQKEQQDQKDQQNQQDQKDQQNQQDQKDQQNQQDQKDQQNQQDQKNQQNQQDQKDQQNQQDQKDQQNQQDQKDQQNQQDQKDQQNQQDQKDQQNQQDQKDQQNQQDQKDQQNQQDQKDQQNQQDQKDQQEQDALKNDKEEEQQAQEIQTNPKTEQELEQEQALKQYLKQLPNDPGQLLKRKFEYQMEQNRRRNTFVDEQSDQVW